MPRGRGNDNPVDDLGVALAAFRIHYGIDDTKLMSWQQICHDCGIQPGPSITKCKKALRKINVNIWDFIRAKQNDNLPPRMFPSKAALREDLKRKGRRFPLYNVKTQQNQLLKAFLVQIY